MTRGGGQGSGNSNYICPYHFRTAWEYADVERIGWQWVYDHSANDPDGDSITYELCEAMDANFTDQSGAPNAYLAPTKFIDTFLHHPYPSR